MFYVSVSRLGKGTKENSKIVFKTSSIKILNKYLKKEHKMKDKITETFLKKISEKGYEKIGRPFGYVFAIYNLRSRGQSTGQQDNFRAYYDSEVRVNSSAKNIEENTYVPWNHFGSTKTVTLK